MVLNGLVTIRAYRKIDYFNVNCMVENEKSANVTFTYMIANRWIGVRFDMAVVLITGIAASLCMASRGYIEANMLTFSLQNLTDVVIHFSVSIRMIAELNNFMTASQRIIGYTELDLEDELVKELDSKLTENQEWPGKGGIKFENVTMSYRDTLEPSVRNLDFEVQPGMKVGIVGRTGAGKSSILQILFRLVDPLEGKCLIDGIDISTIGLHLLRKKIAYIPQSPFLIQGTIRENLDPFEEKTDTEVWEILKQVKLDEHISTMKEGLLSKCSESNNLFSMGQK